MKLRKISKCPICRSDKIRKIGKIKNHLKEIDNKFDLMKCESCLHRFISKFPSQAVLINLYKTDSPLVFGGTNHEVDQKKKFINNGFKNVPVQNDHWIFKYVNINNGRFFEIGPGLCRLYKTFLSKGWSCQGLEPRSFVKIKGIKKTFNEIKKNNDIVAAFDVLEHVENPIEILKKINKKMKKNGQIFLTFPHSESFKSKILKERWQMVVPLAHLHFFSGKSTDIMLKKAGFRKVVIKDFSFVEVRRLFRNLIKLPFLILKDIFKFKFKNITNRIFEFYLNFLDLIKGDQLKVVAIKI